METHHLRISYTREGTTLSYKDGMQPHSVKAVIDVEANVVDVAALELVNQLPVELKTALKKAFS